MEKFYVTTPIYYVNAKPHVGHAYTTIIADVLARWNRLCGREVFFLTGTDEHGSKVEKAASAAGKDVKGFVDDVMKEYVDTWKVLNISYDKFIRTTDKEHEAAVSEFIKRLWDNGDIYKGTYEGWYCTPDETFITDLELKDGKCPECGREVHKVKEDAYFFKLSKYREKLLEFYKDKPGFLIPKTKLNEVLNRMKDELRDLDITRKTVKWGVPFPFDKEHTVYVWFDALINYISALGWPSSNGGFSKFWPADVHLVGKEIVWFHSAIWPAMLMSAGLDIPKKILVNGFWVVEGRKMSKSIGNVVSPVDLSKKYSADAFRYALIREKPTWEDGDFSEASLVSRINGELMADLSNLVARVLTLAQKFDGKFHGDVELEKELDLSKITRSFEAYDVNRALNEIWGFIRSVNKYINDKEPWRLKGEGLSAVLYNALESLRIISILLSPFMPETCDKIAEQLGTEIGGINECSFREFGSTVKRGKNLFEKISQ